MSYNIIGDIAGNYLTLMALLAKMPKDATPISLGDMVDRGPRSKEVLDFFMQPGNLAVLGNHDHMMLSYHLHDGFYDYGIWFMNGGRHTLDSFPDGKVDSKYLVWIADIPLYMELPPNKDGLKGFLSHAIKDPDISLEEATDFGEGSYSYKLDRSIIWNRGEAKNMSGYYQICGHNSHWGLTYFQDDGEYGCCIDTSRTKVLTGVHWPSMEVFQQEYID